MPDEPQDPVEEPVPSPEPEPINAKKPLRKAFLHWGRLRLYSWTFLLILGIIILGISIIILRIREAPVIIIKQLLDTLPYPYHIGQVTWINSRTIDLDDLALGSSDPDKLGEADKIFFRSARVEIRFSWYGLMDRKLDSLDLKHPQLFLERFDAAIQSNPWQTNAAQAYMVQQLDWVVREAKISSGTIYIENIGPNQGLFVPIRMGVENPVILKNLHLNDLDDGDSGQEEQLVRVPNVSLVSPFDPLSPVVSLPMTEIKFTYGGLWRRHLKEINFIQPSLYLGPDLFWFADGFQGSNIRGKDTKPMLPWSSDRVVVRYGGIGISAFGQKPVSFPFGFDAEADDVRTDQLDRLSLKTKIPIKRFDKEYKSYKVKIVNLHGNLAFNLPPASNFIENAVQLLDVDSVSWNDLAITHGQSTLIFNPFGVIGHINGDCYGGKVVGNFGIFYGDNYPWVISLQATGVNVEPITSKLTPNYLGITGKASGQVNVKGQTITILNSSGSLKMDSPGVMQLKAVQEVLDKYPIVGNQIKLAAVQLVAQSLKYYPYTGGEITLNYTPQLGEGHLKLDGPNGKRNFDIFYHPGPDPGLKSGKAGH